MSVDSSATPNTLKTELPSTPHARSAIASWGNVVLAALLMLATLPGRTQGLGLITEPMLGDLSLDRLTYAHINFWATLLGSLLCLPAGWLIDRRGLRGTSMIILLLLAGTVWQMSAASGDLMVLFILVLLTRALGQSALSVASITTVGKSFGLRAEWAMGVFSVLLSIFFIVAFLVVGAAVTEHGWRIAWRQVGWGLLVVAALVVLFLREPKSSGPIASSVTVPGLSLEEALRRPAFWIFAGSTALFGLVSSGFGLFNEAVLAERGFDQKDFHHFLAIMTLFALVGQMICGWLSGRLPMGRLLAAAMFLYALGLGLLPRLQSHFQLWAFAAAFGIAAGFITVIFFAVWGQTFGPAHLGRIQGAAQMLTVFASAIGPLLFAKGHEIMGSYTPLLYALAPAVVCVGLLAWRTKITPFHSPPALS